MFFSCHKNYNFCCGFVVSKHKKVTIHPSTINSLSLSVIIFYYNDVFHYFVKSLKISLPPPNLDSPEKKKKKEIFMLGSSGD